LPAYVRNGRLQKGKGGFAACRGHCSGVSATHPTSTVHQSRLSDRLADARKTRFGNFHGEVEQGGLRRTVELERELETPQHRPPMAATRFSLRWQTAAANVAGPASSLDTADAH